MAGAHAGAGRVATGASITALLDSKFPFFRAVFLHNVVTNSNINAGQPRAAEVGVSLAGIREVKK